MNEKLNEYSALQTEDSAHETVGTSLCSAWKVAPGVVWVQSRSPKLAKKLKQIAGHKQVAYSVVGGYLRTFEFKKSLAWARKWIARHTAANEPFSDQKSFQSNRAQKKGSSRPPKVSGVSKSNDVTILDIAQSDERRMAA
jgi:hypothetical protein